ncbi:MAG: tetratricopeptide repeat protein [Spirochaetes bacterium]|jgi:predicted negative regulator of RcsB-dependent stress response|nr:tetratricopeptide repeat protein [Spirochaetota bacterium]
MYYRYKVHKKRSGILKVLVIVAMTVGVIYAGYQYRQMLMFWKYSTSKLYKKVESVNTIKDSNKRRETLSGLAADMDSYKGDNQLNVEAFLMSGKTHFLYAESLLEGSFTDLIINDGLRDIGKKARRELIKSMKDLKKASALGGGLDPEYAVMLAMAYFYTDYYQPQEIYRMIEKSDIASGIKSVENHRFYSLMLVLGKKEDAGIRYLSDKGNIKSDIKGKLFLATAERMAKRYTNSIINYKAALASTDDQQMKKLIHINLGIVYHNQSLFRESMSHFNSVVEIDPGDINARIWIGKNHFAMGEKDKARAIWNDILARDKSNREVQKLLGV